MNPLNDPMCTEGQGFGQNFNPSYHSGGLIGHTGIDVNCGYASPIDALCAGYVYSTFPVEHPAADGYTAVFTICETPLETFEFSYGHVAEIDCQIGQTVKIGDSIAKEGNHGIVYSGNTLVTLAQQAAGDHDGHHRHYQKRPVIKTKRLSGRCLQTAQGTYMDAEGYYYQIYDFNNGFNGCVDWTAPLFNRNLFAGTTGYDVYLLQKACIATGFGTYEPTGTFGPRTFASVVQLQRLWGLPPTGLVGPMTRERLNTFYKQLI
ncbi:MAG: peptidoglycan-binding protein [Patescibacteria group bacterium]